MGMDTVRNYRTVIYRTSAAQNDFSVTVQICALNYEEGVAPHRAARPAQQRLLCSSFPYSSLSFFPSLSLSTKCFLPFLPPSLVLSLPSFPGHPSHRRPPPSRCPASQHVALNYEIRRSLTLDEGVNGDTTRAGEGRRPAGHYPTGERRPTRRLTAHCTTIRQQRSEACITLCP